MTYVFVIFSIQYVESELTKPHRTVRAAITPMIVPVVGKYVKAPVLSRGEPIETAASNICAEPYSDEAIPATWPNRLIHPTTQLIEGTQSFGASFETV